MMKQRVEPVMQELDIMKYQVTETMLGKSLEGTGYDYPLKDLIPKQAERNQTSFSPQSYRRRLR
jgi:isoleucyl-tRNA synthetase